MFEAKQASPALVRQLDGKRTTGAPPADDAVAAIAGTGERSGDSTDVRAIAARRRVRSLGACRFLRRMSSSVARTAQATSQQRDAPFVPQRLDGFISSDAENRRDASAVSEHRADVPGKGGNQLVPGEI
jgi:hypothetical protein